MFRSTPNLKKPVGKLHQLVFIFLALIGSSVLRPLYMGTGQYLGLTECVVCSDQDGTRLVIAKRDLEKHKRSERHKSCVARLELEMTTRQNRASAGTDMLQIPTGGNGDDDQAFAYDVGGIDPLPPTSIDVGVVTPDEDAIMSIADAPVELPEPSQDYYDQYWAAVLRGENEVRLPPYREPDDASLDHNGDFIQYV